MVPSSPSNVATKGSNSSAETTSSGENMAGPRPALAAGQMQLEGGADSNKIKNGSNVRLSLYLRNGKVVLMNSCGDQQATIIRTGLMDGRMVWSGDGSILAVAGFRKSQSVSTVRFFQPTGQLLFTLSLGTKVSSLARSLSLSLSLSTHLSKGLVN